nr:PilZ domain-containing protein [Bowmanella dokdonensis]
MLDRQESRFHSELIGYRFGRYLVIRFDDTVLTNSANGLVAICRFLVEQQLGECFAFKSEIISTVWRPDKILYLAFPEEIHRRALRAKKRLTLEIPASIQLNSEKGRGKPFDGLLIDVSPGGCRFQFEESHTGRKVNLLPILVSIHCQQRGLDMQVAGMVRNSRMQDGHLTIGIQFSEAQPVLENLV